MIKGIDDTYIIIEKIGRGGISSIYKAYHKRLKKEVVIKKIHSDVRHKIDTRIEADILKNLKHSYLPKVLDFIVADGDYYTVTDYIDGISFEDVIKNGKEFTQKELIRWSIELCEALEYLHSQKPPIIHGDIKPGNVMLTKEGNICLIDFNISNVFKSEGMVAVGYSNGFSPPEQYSRKAMSGILNREEYESYVQYTEQWSSIVTRAKETRTTKETEIGKNMEEIISQLDDTELLCSNENSDSRSKDDIVFLNEVSDVYSLGATMYFMVTGHKPRVAMLFEQDIDEYEGISDGLKYIIKKAMASNPSERFESVTRMKQTLINIHKLDSRYRRFVWRQYLMAGGILIGFLASFLIIQAGRLQIQNEKQTRYDSLTEQIQNCSDEEQMISLFDEAIDLNADKPDMYYQRAVFYYKTHDYESCRDFLEDEVIPRRNIFPEEMLSEMYFLYGECDFYQEKYEQAIKWYEDAIRLQKQEIYYPGYSIALIKVSRMDDAKKILTLLEEKNDDLDGVYMIKGELAYSQGELEKSREAYFKCKECTDDEYMYFRSVYSYGNVSREMNEISALKEGIEVLQQSVSKGPLENVNLIKEETAELYVALAVKSGETTYYSDAVKLYEELVNEGGESLTGYLNLSMLYSKTGENKKAMQLLKTVLKKYGEDYRIYKRLALTEAVVQSAKNNTDRDYERFLEYYMQAQSLYKKREQNKETDLEMKQLEQIKADLKSGGWFK